MTDEAPPTRPVEEMAYCLLKFANGVHASVVAGALLPRYDNDILLYGSKAKIVCRGTLGVPLNNRTGELAVDGGPAAIRQEYPTCSAADKMVDLVEDFNRHVRDGTKLEVSGANGLQMIRIAAALQESSRTRKVVAVR
jgi:predicted dehydrogenase